MEYAQGTEGRSEMKKFWNERQDVNLGILVEDDLEVCERRPNVHNVFRGSQRAVKRSELGQTARLQV